MGTIVKNTLDFGHKSFIDDLQGLMESTAEEQAKRVLRALIRYEKLDQAWRRTDNRNRQARIARLQQMCHDTINNQDRVQHILYNRN